MTFFTLPPRGYSQGELDGLLTPITRLGDGAEGGLLGSRVFAEFDSPLSFGLIELFDFFEMIFHHREGILDELLEGGVLHLFISFFEFCDVLLVIPHHRPLNLGRWCNTCAENGPMSARRVCHKTGSNAEDGNAANGAVKAERRSAGNTRRS